MKKISSTRRISDPHQRVMAKTGFHCPANGFWRPGDRSGNPIFIFEGSIMPASGGDSTVWYLEEPSAAPAPQPEPRTAVANR